jgi:hypothetical protein
LKIPTLVFVAGQSLGKSLFIAIRAAYPLSFSAYNIGTRCPVRYVFRNSLDVGFEGVKVKGNLVPNKLIMEAVAEHMKALENTVGFSNEELVVQVSFPGIQNAIYIDLPGIPDRKEGHYEDVKAMIQNAVKYPETIIVAMLDASAVDPVSICIGFF